VVAAVQRQSRPIDVNNNNNENRKGTMQTVLFVMSLLQFGSKPFDKKLKT
jgi:hypothetical protein